MRFGIETSMAMRCTVAAALGVIVCLAAPVHADPRGDIAAKTRAAMASYDALDYEAARRQLNQALAIAKRAKLDKDPIVARVYLDLGIAQLAGADPEAAKVALLSAVQIDPKIAIEPAYRSPELVRMLDEARAAAGDPGEVAAEDCRAARGLQHTPNPRGQRGTPQRIEVVIGSDLAPARVVVMYRPQGAIDFSESRLARQAGCHYVGTIPADAMYRAVVHYYVAAYDASNHVLAAMGSSGAPTEIRISRGSDGPEVHTIESTPPAQLPPEMLIQSLPGAAVAWDQAPPAPRRPRIVLAVSGGTGFGYVSGRTEGDNLVQQCCIGSSPVVISPELRLNVGRRLSIGAVARFGLPLGANVMGHSTLAPAGLVRLGYALSDGDRGLHVMGELGFGILRNTIKLSADMPGMDVDVVAQGPVLVGAGVGYTWRLGDRVALLVDLDVIGGIAVVDKLGTAVHLNTGVGADMRAGVAFGF